MAKEPVADDAIIAATMWGMTGKTWLMLVQNLGIPVLFMAFVLFMAYQWLPPLAEAHISLLKRTGDTQESMNDTLAQQRDILETIANQPRPSEEFATQIHDEHMRTENIVKDSAEKINDIHKVVVKAH